MTNKKDFFVAPLLAMTKKNNSEAISTPRNDEISLWFYNSLYPFIYKNKTGVMPQFYRVKKINNL